MFTCEADPGAVLLPVITRRQSDFVPYQRLGFFSSNPGLIGARFIFTVAQLDILMGCDLRFPNFLCIRIKGCLWGV